MNVLIFVFCLSFSLLLFGISIAWIDLDLYGSGLYLALVSVVVVVVVLAFCLVGTDEQTAPTVAKQVWSTTRQTIRRYAPMLPVRTLSKQESRHPMIVLHTENGESTRVVVAETPQEVVEEPSLPTSSIQSNTLSPIEELSGNVYL
uniref:Transmembrane protein n=1 Tax=Steinernema glaseri TaxID=37863 RepID=A0A1I7ZVX6_9BILA